ncbi:MAG: ABC transporter ATP-binding protein [Spirochaetota bacterium]|nr:MAG: ABC transporter ATP-binding protein [Spirochaetota bacterium]
MDYYSEEEKENQKLFSREVLRLLFKYVFKYRNYMFIAVLLIGFITGASVSVPWILRIIIDRYIFKQGRVVELDRYTARVRRPLYLDNRKYFLFQSELKHLSKEEKQTFINEGILSEEVYILIETLSPMPELEKKLQFYTQSGGVLNFSRDASPVYLMNTETLVNFTVAEVFALRTSDFRQIILYTLIIVAILLVQFGASYVQILYLMRLSQLAMRDLRKDLFDHLLHLDTSYFDRNPVGKLVNRVTNDIETLNELFSSVLLTLFQDLLMMVGIAGVMFFTDLRLAGIVACTFPLILLVTIIFRIKVRKAYRVIRTKLTELNSFLNESITGIRIIQIFTREIKNLKSFVKKNDAVYIAQRGQLYVYAVFRPLISFLRWISIACVIYFGARGIGLDTLSYGLLVMFIAYVERFFAPVQDLSQKFDIMQSATAAGEKIISLFNIEAEEKVSKTIRAVKKSKVIPERFVGHIVFDDVWFAYEPGAWVLKGVSFSVEPKQTLAIVGETGAGKSTIINILSRFYEIQKGKVLIDGIDISEIPHRILRENVVSVMQDVFLFSSTVRENITLGKAYEAEWFKRITEATHIDQFIASLPEKDNEPVMERGVTFSLGQRQLLSFARALYYNPPVLVLDEATSAIDTETELLVQDAISHLIKGRTSIIIAHRLSTIRNADRIVVLDRGKIVEEGRHGELIKKRGIYHHLFKLQFMPL